MLVRELGLMILLTGAAGWAQQPPQQAQPLQPPAVQAAPQVPVTDAERKRFEEIRVRRERGEAISPEDRRFAEDIRARLNPARVVQPRPTPLTEVQRRRIEGIQTPRTAVMLRGPLPATPPLERALGGPAGRWWTRPEVAQRLGLTTDQTRKMDDIFQQHRLKLIDLNAVVQKEEAIMEPLVSAEQPDEAKIVAQIDKVAQARAELEKANARMLLGIRRLLTPEQWSKLKSEPLPAPQPVRR